MQHAREQSPRAVAFKSLGYASALVLAFLVLVVCIRSWVFVRYPHAHFDSDQAVLGIMAKDIASGSRFPVFMYGQRYLLVISSWLCAPLFVLFGANSVTLKLPMLALNLLVVGVVWWQLRRDPRVGATGAVVAALPFALPGVVTTSRLVEHAGGNIEPFAFIMLGYVFRNRPVLLGLTFALGFLNREFSLLGLLALIAIDVCQRRVRERLRVYGVSISIAVGLSALIKYVGSLSPDYYGSTPQPSFRADFEGLLGYARLQLPTLLGGRELALREYNITSSLQVGRPWVLWVFLAWLLAALLVRSRSLSRAELDGLPFYLLLVGAGQALAYSLICPAPFEPMLVRYALLSFVGFVGLIALSWGDARLRAVTALMVAVLCASNGYDHLRLIREYVRESPKHENELLATELLNRGVRYGFADYWVAYDISWLTQEAVTLSPHPGQTMRVRRYRDTVDAHPSEAFEIRSDGGCKKGVNVLRWTLCKPKRKR